MVMHLLRFRSQYPRCTLHATDSHLDDRPNWGAANSTSQPSPLTELNLDCVPAANLVQNYRSHTTLLEVPNTLFYQGTLVASADQSQLLPPRWSELEDQGQAHLPPPPPMTP